PAVGVHLQQRSVRLRFRRAGGSGAVGSGLRRGPESLFLFFLFTIPEDALFEPLEPVPILLLVVLFRHHSSAHPDLLLAPNIPVPTRTIVEPSSIAISKSPVIPIERTSRCSL